VSSPAGWQASKVTPQDLRRSLCSIAGRRGIDPIEAAQITGHSPAVWATHYARSFGKAQRDEARAVCSSTVLAASRRNRRKVR
jgi:hypothetical protein